MATALGGALLLAVLATRRGPWMPDLARNYEALFWGAAGLLVLTGVGNLGALGVVPARGSRWGDLFAVKIGAVVLLLALSMARTMAVARARGAPSRFLRVAYGCTAGLLAGIASLGVQLAHG